MQISVLAHPTSPADVTVTVAVTAAVDVTVTLTVAVTVAVAWNSAQRKC